MNSCPSWARICCSESEAEQFFAFTLFPAFRLKPFHRCLRNDGRVFSLDSPLPACFHSPGPGVPARALGLRNSLDAFTTDGYKSRLVTDAFPNQGQPVFLPLRSSAKAPETATADRLSSVIAGSCAIKNRKLRQVRKEAAVANLFMCTGVPGYPFFAQSCMVPFPPTRHRFCCGHDH